MPDAPPSTIVNFFAHHRGEMAARIRTFDWAATPLGPIEEWPQALTTAVDLMLASPGATSVMWGPERTQLYNDAYIAIADGRHPEALGQTAAQNWAEAYTSFLGPILDRVFAGESVVVDQQTVALLSADGRTAEHVFTATFTPVRNESGAVAGVFHPLIEVTEQVRAQAAMRETSRTLDAILNNTREAVFLMDHRQQCVYANAAAEQLTGYKLPEMQRRPLHDVIHHKKPDGSRYPLEECPIDRAFPERAQVSGEELFVHKDGSFYPVAYTASPLLNEAGEPVGTVIEARNISERKVREAALRELHETLERRVAEALAERKVFADVVDNSSAAVTALDMNFNVLAINSANVEAFKLVFGKRPRVGDNLLKLLAAMPEHQAQLRAYWSRALSGEEYVLTEEFGELERRTYEVRFGVLRNTAGEQIGAASTAYDVTERVRAEARLAEAETARREADALYRAYFENTPEALFVIGVTDDGCFVVEEINPAHEAGVGLKLSDIRGKRIEDIIPAEAADKVLASYRRVVESGDIIQYREAFDLNGDPQHWDTSLVPMRNADGRIVRIIGSSRNVTRQVVAEEALRQSQKMEAMGSLTGGVAHDFNNLLTPIIGSLDMLVRKSIGSERERRLIDGALQSAERAKTLVQRLLAFARRQPLQPVAVDLRRLVEGMVELISSTLGPTVDVRVEVAPDLPPAKADPNQLEMALLNLAVNARDAMPDGGELRISAHFEEVPPHHPSGLAPGKYARLSVCDTGVGMNEDTRQRAIEPFFSTKGVGKGTGLGLSMVHGLTAQLGGGITIQSAPDHGTTVDLWLPASAEPVGSEEKEPATPDESLGRGTALLVDDEELVRMSTADMLIDLGFQVVEAGSAQAALRLIESGTDPDLLITDHLMPGMTGADLARHLRRLKPHLPVLIVSGYAEVEGIAPDLPRLTKPFRNSELATSIAMVMPANDD